MINSPDCECFLRNVSRNHRTYSRLLKQSGTVLEDNPELDLEVTWVHAVAGDVAPCQPLGELVGEEHVAQFAVAVGLEELPAEPARAQVSVHRQSLNTTR